MYTKASFTDELKRIWTTITAFKPSWYKMGSQDVEITDAWKMYQNARQSTLDELLLGDVKLRSEIEVLKNFGTTSGSESTMERGTLIDDKKNKVTTDQVQATVKSQRGSAYQLPEGVTHIRRGSVLDDGWWWPFKNDAWVIGGVHGLKRFHLAMAKAPDDLLWDASSKRPRVLGRELLGLAAFGYSLIGVPAWAKKDPPSPTTAPVKPGSPTTVPPVVKTTPVDATTIRATIGNVFAPQKKSSAQDATFAAYYASLSKVAGIDTIKNGILKNEVAFAAYDFSKI